ncbi:hypothetical protein chiPu_0012204 [Chiloscyllium punctatum]|uniref:Spexin n=1 Tax=Chiloscyllium punctatum TaxID=137246 RepID=A0A401STK5_CHIPU|nr:hypothetical protein [Chiloscyllium punctatum]
MKGLGVVIVHTLLMLLLTSFLVQARGAPQDRFQRRNWTPQAMLYLKGAQGRRFIADNGEDGGDLLENIDIGKR